MEKKPSYKFRTKDTRMKNGWSVREINRTPYVRQKTVTKWKSEIQNTSAGTLLKDNACCAYLVLESNSKKFDPTATSTLLCSSKPVALYSQFLSPVNRNNFKLSKIASNYFSYFCFQKLNTNLFNPKI